ncbi:hypothetical protein N9D31_03170 [Oligoflexaceae bacterium]|nr:hypothetical protein [Oligoflexaceae bacterium]
MKFVFQLLAIVTLHSCHISSSDSDAGSEGISTSSSSNDPITLDDFDGEATSAELEVMLTNSDLSCSSGDTLSFDGSSWICASKISGDNVEGGTIASFRSTGIADDATSEAFTIDAAGNVGIGTPTPFVELDVFSDDPVGTNVKIGNSTSGYASLVLDASDGDGVGVDYFRIRQNNDLSALISTGGSGGSIHLAAKSNIPQLTLVEGGYFGVGTSEPKSRLQVSGYMQLDLTAGAPPAGDCDHADERGRTVVDNAASLVYYCMDSGWVSK